jgi:hypothetical protein
VAVFSSDVIFGARPVFTGGCDTNPSGRGPLGVGGCACRVLDDDTASSAVADNVVSHRCLMLDIICALLVAWTVG